MSYVTGRDRATNDIVTLPPTGVEFAMPAICYMEAAATYESMRREHNKFQEEFGKKIGECERGIVFADREQVVKCLRLSEIAIGQELNAIRQRFLDLIRGTSSFVRLIEVDHETLLEATNRAIIKDMTDNLILAILLRDARSQPPERPKCLLKENFKDFDMPDAKSALTNSGIKYFRSAAFCHQWFSSFTE